MSLRHLTADEISQLMLQGCRCTCWDNISVADPFMADRYRNVAFDGCVVLLPAQRNGSYRSTPYEAGIYNARIADCKVGRDVHISNVGNVISDCDICDNAIICNVGTIGCVGATSHGNGVEVDVLSDVAQFQYKVDNVYAPQAEATLRFDDPQLGIDWRISPDDMLLSDKDMRGYSFAEIAEKFSF